MADDTTTITPCAGYFARPVTEEAFQAIQQRVAEQHPDPDERHRAIIRMDMDRIRRRRRPPAPPEAARPVATRLRSDPVRSLPRGYRIVAELLRSIAQGHSLPSEAERWKREARGNPFSELTGTEYQWHMGPRGRYAHDIFVASVCDTWGQSDDENCIPGQVIWRIVERGETVKSVCIALHIGVGGVQTARVRLALYAGLESAGAYLGLAVTEGD